MSETHGGYSQVVVDVLNSQLGQTITRAFAEGEKAERERIIKLLEKQGAAMQPLIALIKGEK